MNKFQSFISRMFRIPARFRSFGGSTRMYTSAKNTRLTDGWSASDSSADTELVSSIRQLRIRSRALGRDNPYAKRAKAIVVNNIIGTGMRLQAQVKTVDGELSKRINEDIEAAFEKWSYAEYCHTGGRLCFADMERAIIAQVFDAGEVFIRKYNRSFGDSNVPFALEVIEAERIADDIGATPYQVGPGNQVRLGIEVDKFFRPAAYYLRQYHLGEIRFNTQPDFVERVPADQIIHLARVNRWPQTRGEPWLHAVAITLNDMDGYSEAEITRARSQACIVGAIETPEDSTAFGEEQADGTVEMEVAPATFKRLNPGEKLNTGPMNAPNPVYADFMREKKREVAVGIGVNYASLSGDYSQADYSPLKLSLNDDRDSWRDHQQWYIRAFREIVHKEWLRQAALSGALKTVSLDAYAADPSRFEEVTFRPRGWAFVDPTKEVAANKDAVRSGFSTMSEILANQGCDLEEYIEERQEELKQLNEAGIVLDSDPSLIAGKAGAIQAVSEPPTPQDIKPQASQTTPQPAPRRVVSLRSE